MPLRLPKRQLGGFCQELVSHCSVSQKDRIGRGVALRNMYLAGTLDGTPSPYPKTTSHLENLSSFLYSPVELLFNIAPEDVTQPDEVAMCKAAAKVLHREIRRGDVDTKLDETVLWSCIKGKTFLKLLWSGRFNPHLIQPEMMGVYREDLSSLDDQEAFFQRTWITFGMLEKLVWDHEDRKEILSRCRSSMLADRSIDSPDKLNFLKQVIVGGGAESIPYRAATDTPNSAQNQVLWMNSPTPSFAPEVLAKLIPLDELWVKDADMNDWTTLQVVGDSIIEGKYIHRNLFSDPSDITDPDLLKRSREDNPLAGHHPYTEFCPNPLDGYFWGRPEATGITLLQLMLNARIDGMNKIMRQQEDPPRALLGFQGVNQNAYAKLKKPGGYLSDASQGAKIETLKPDMPKDLWQDKHEISGAIDEIGGFTPALQGRGESGVRAQGHAEVLTRNGSPRFKVRALRVERQVDAVAGLALDILRARYTKKVAGWIRPSGEEGPASEAAAPQSWISRLFTLPTKQSRRLEFLMADLPEGCKVTVDSHSSSPAFSRDPKELAFALANKGAMDPKELVQATHPANEDELVANIEQREAQKAEFMAAHPEIALQQASGGKKKK